MPPGAIAYNVIDDFGAVGNGIADDTDAVQNMLNALMTLPDGGWGVFPRGTYLITKTLTLVGDYFHHYILSGVAQGFGYDSATRLLWGGPAGVTMFNAWGLNQCRFSDLCFDGGGASILLGRYSSPSVPIIGAGCCTWFHTNQYNGGSFPTIAESAATWNVFFDNCSWTGVVGGLYPACALGDGPQSPGCVTWNGSAYTLYEVDTFTPPTSGDNTVDTVVSTTLTSCTSIGAKSFAVTDASGFTTRRGLQVCMPGYSPWFGIISDISGSTITAADVFGDGCPFPTTMAAAAVYNVFPAATGESLPSGTVVEQNTAIINSQVQGYLFSRCNWYGAGWDTTSPNPQQHTYANVAVYSGANTEQFKWTENCIFTEACYHIYAPFFANNEWVVEDAQFGNFSAAALCMTSCQAPLVKMSGSGTESTGGCGYFLKLAPGGGASAMALIEGCELVFCTVSNPYGAGIYNGGQLKLRGCFLLSTYGLGSCAQPMSIAVAFPGAYASPSVDVEQCNIVGEQYQLSIYNPAGNDQLGSCYGASGGSSNPGTNFTHAWDTSQAYQFIESTYPTIAIRLRGNRGSQGFGEGRGDPLSLPDVDYNPTQLFSASLLSVSGVVSALETYRGQVRSTWSCYDVDYTQCTTLSPVYLATFQSKTIVEEVIVETTQTFSAATCLDCGSSADSPTPFQGIFATQVIPPSNASPPLITSAFPVASSFLTPIWASAGLVYLGVVPHFAGSLSAGHLKVYVKTSVVAI